MALWPKGLLEISLSVVGDSPDYLNIPGVHEVVSRRNPHKVFMVMREHVIKTRYSHLKALLE